MKRFYTSLYLTLLSVSFCTAQDRFALTAGGSPVYTYEKYRQDLTGMPITGSSTNYGYTIGVGASYQIQHKWTMSTGVWYNYQSAHLGQFKNRVSTLQVPILLNYKPSVKKISPYFSGGIVGNYHYQDRLNAPLGGGPSDEFIRLKYADYYLSAMLGVGAAYTLTSRLSFVIQPYGQYQLRTPSIYTNYTNLQVGVSVQVHYKL